MKHIVKIATIIPAVAISCLALSGSASAMDYTIQIKNSLTGDNISNHQFEFELRNAVTNELIQTKQSNEETITFDPITGNFSRAPIDFYKVIEKNLGEDGMTYDEQVAYIGLHTDGKVAYQKDNTYKYVSKDGQPHPFHATEKELQGEAYATLDLDTGLLTFFRDSSGKYTNEQVEDHKVYFANFENPARNVFGGSVTISGSNVYIPSVVKEIIFKDAIRPKGSMEYWFSNYSNLTKADLSKLDTSRVESLSAFMRSAKKLSDMNVATLDLSNLNTSGEPLAYFLLGTQVEEFDTRNYDSPSFKADSRPMQSMLAQTPKLKYLNLSNFYGQGSSAEFSNTPCLESLTIYQTHYFYRMFGGDIGVDSWLNTTDGSIKTRYNVINPGDGVSTANAGTYVRPICNVTPVGFENSYKKPKAPKTIATKESVKNPDTATSAPAIYFIIFGALSAGTILIGRRISKLTK